MEFTLEDKMRAIFNSGNVVKIEKVLRTKGGENHYKYIWTVDGIQTTNWFGFNTIDECVEDCLTQLTLAHLEMAKESMLQSNKSYHLRMANMLANMLANGEPVDADEIDLGILSIKLKTMVRNSEELISQLKIIVDKYDTQDDNVLKILLNYREELKEIRLRSSR